MGAAAEPSAMSDEGTVRDRWHHDPERAQSEYKTTETKVVDHAMQAEFGASRSFRQSSRTGCRDENHDKRVAAALARQLARDNPNLMVQQVGSTVVTENMNRAVDIRRANDLDP